MYTNTYIYIYLYVNTYAYTCIYMYIGTDAVRTHSEHSEPGEAQRARLDCNAHDACINLHIRHA